MIFIYGAVCLSMIVFNLAYGLVRRSKEPRIGRKCGLLAEMIRGQLAELETAGRIDPAHLRRLRRRLRRVSWLIAFDRTLEAVSCESETGRNYLIRLQPLFLELSMEYLKRDTLQAAYFSWFLSRYTAKRRMPVDLNREILLEYMKRENLYCRINALQAFYAYGEPDYVMRALRLQDDGKVFLHEKILTEGLLSYAGNHDELIAELWRELDGFSSHTQLAVLNYIRFQSGAFQREMLEIMTDGSKDKEVRLSAVRYFGRYPYEPALQQLLEFAGSRDTALWEYATVSLSALASYRSREVTEIFKSCLHSSNWHIRAAAAEGLERQGADYNDLTEIVSGNDRYAREMMMYRLEARRIRDGK